MSYSKCTTKVVIMFKIKKTLAITVLLLSLCFSVSTLAFSADVQAQSVMEATTWDKTYGGTWEAKARSLVQTTDGGYAIAGYTGSFGVTQKDFWLVKTDGQSVIPEFPSWLIPIFLMATIFVVVLKRRVHSLSAT